MTTYAYRHARTYDDCLKAYRNDKELKAALFDALTDLADDPFHHPSLQTHRVKRAQGETYTSYVGSRGHRLIWRLVGDHTVVLMLFGEHDAVYRRAENLRLEIDDEAETLRVIDVDPREGARQPYADRRVAEGSVFMAWTDHDLTAFGFEPQEIPVLRRLDGDDELLAIETRMRPAAWRTAMNLVMHGHPDGEDAATEQRARREAEEASLPEPETDPVEEARLARGLRSANSREELAAVEPEVLAEVLSKPIEDWMVFLHPDQAKLAERSFSGPARVRGAAGTGKTVVGLHRAVHLARSYPGPILFTTYIRTLPPVFEHLFARLAPDLAGRVEFKGLHSWALGFLHRAGLHPKLDVQACNAAFDEAWLEVTGDCSPLGSSRLARSYYRQEIDWVIKGRDLRGLRQYLALERTGRGTPLSESHRRAVWSLHEEYRRRLRRRRVVDFGDMLIDALTAVRDAGLRSPYQSVIVDEAQDLTEVAVRLVHALAGGDRPDGLLLLGDGQQSIYPGGYSLGSLGISVVGRSSVLTVNYRNTSTILAAAMRVVAERAYDDNEPAFVTDGARPVTAMRQGRAPTFSSYASVDDHDLGLVEAITNAISEPGVGPGDLAVLLPTNALVKDHLALISSMELPTQTLDAYKGTPNALVKVGTYQRAKGLEFKYVFLPRLEPSTLGEEFREGEDERMHKERLDLLARQLFVAMTRARDGLWAAWVGEPSSIVGPMVQHGG